MKSAADPDLSGISQALADRYRAGVDGRTHWLTYHLHKDRMTEFGEALIQALASCGSRLPALGERLVDELINTGYTPTAQDPAAWRAGFQQLLQKFGAECAEVAAVEKNPKLDGRHMSMFLSPKATPKTK